MSDPIIRGLLANRNLPPRAPDKLNPGPAPTGAAGMPGDAEANDLAPSFTPVTEHYGLLR
jgi:hypothetical protein